MRTLIVLLALLFSVGAIAEPTSIVPKSLLKEMKVKLERLSKIENSQPKITILGVEIVQDVKGRVFVKDTAEVKVKFEEVGLEYVGNIHIAAKISQFHNKPKSPFISRFGLATVAEQKEFGGTQLDKNSIYVTYKIFQYKRLSLESIANFRRWGAGAGYHLSPNVSFLVGVNYRYTETLAGNTKAWAGLGFKF